VSGPGAVREFTAVVADIRLESRTGGKARWQMTLDRTGFTAGDTGILRAVARSGACIEVPVLSVVAGEDGELWHVVEKPLAAGTDVAGEVSARSVHAIPRVAETPLP
jgi:alanyl-tRNA synthetase